MSETTNSPAPAVIDLPVLGMTCAACVRRVERAVSALPGVASTEVNLPLSRARITVTDSALATPRAAAAAIRDAGYEVPDDVLDATSSARTGEARLAAIARAEAAELRTLSRDARLAIGLTVPLLFIAMAHGLDLGISDRARVIIEMILGTIVVLVPGRHYFRRGLIAVRHASPDMNTLIALGAGTAWLSSTVVALLWLARPAGELAAHHTAGGMPPVYFEAGAAIVAFVMIGKVLESRARARVSNAVRGLLALAPARARRVANESDEDVDVAALAPGDVIIVRPGERVAADGTIVEGTSAVDESLLSGESMPVDKEEGSPVYAGTLNHTGVLRVRVARAGADTALARIARAVEDAQGRKAPIARLADRVSAYFVPAVLAIAALTFVGWFATHHDATTSLSRMVAVLVIACPCALGLATPAAVAVATSRAAELGLLFRGGDAIERASRIDVVCIDKTGTLTTGRPTLVNAAEIPDDVLRLAASAERHSEHPLARAILDAAERRRLTLAAAEHVVVAPGGGISATVEGHAIVIGTVEHVVAAGIAAHHPPGPPGPGTLVAIDGVVRAGLDIVDPPAPGAREAIESLRGKRMTTIMITGDRRDAAQRVGKELGIDQVRAEIKPTRKAILVGEERVGGHHVAMVGDGINDAPALAASDLGIALASGTDIAAAAADVTLLRGGIGALPSVFALARATMRTIRTNLAAAFIYNAVCIPIAAAGLLSPVLASVAMSLSSVSVLASSLRLRRYGQ